jgi:V/A-type H+-transporting ATPase subunit E
MALADILRAMEQEVDVEVARIHAQAEATIAQIRAAAEAEARAIHERHRREILVPLQHERARRLNRARLDALRAVSRAREGLYAEALARTRERLAHVREDARYPAMLRALMQEAHAQLNEPGVLRADPRDEKILRTMVTDVPIQFDLQTWGGVELQSADGKIRVVNTLEARLEQAQEQLRQAVMPLFEDVRTDG